MSTEATTEATTMSTEATTGTTTERHWTDPFKGTPCERWFQDAERYPTFESWWADCENGSVMVGLLKVLRYGDSESLRLLACRLIRETALHGRTIWETLTSGYNRLAVDVAECYANGQAAEEELAESNKDAWRVLQRVRENTKAPKPAEQIALAAYEVGVPTFHQSGLWNVLWQTSRAVLWNSMEVTFGDSSRFCSTRSAHLHDALKGIQRQQADIIRSMVSASEIAPLFERYIQTPQGEAP